MVAGTVAGLGSMTTLSFPVHRLFHTFLEHFSRWIKPPTIFLVTGPLAKLLSENALLRQQLIILRLIASASIVRNITFLRCIDADV